MLTLTRKVGESVCIGDDIRIVVKEVKGKQVRIGIIAPQDVYVCREELYEKIHAANIGARGGPSVNVLDSISGLFKPPGKSEGSGGGAPDRKGPEKKGPGKKDGGKKDAR